MRIQPRAVIFDYGHVLCRPQAPEEIEAMAAFFDVAVERFPGVYWPYRVPYDKGDLSPTAYWNTVAADLSRNHLSKEQIEALTELDNKSWAHPDPVMIDWARDLRDAGVRTAILQYANDAEKASGLLLSLVAGVRSKNFLLRCA